MENNEFDRLYDEAYYEIQQLSDKDSEYYRRTLSLAQFCYRQGFDMKAYELYHHVFLSFSWHCEGEERIFFEEALEGLSFLLSSNDECVWENCSQIVGDYMIWKREQEEQK